MSTWSLDARRTAVCVLCFQGPGIAVRFERLIESSGEDRLSAGAETGPTPNTCGALVWGGARPAREATPGLTLHSCCPGSGTADMELHSSLLSPSGRRPSALAVCGTGRRLAACAVKYMPRHLGSQLAYMEASSVSVPARGRCRAMRHAWCGWKLCRVRALSGRACGRQCDAPQDLMGPRK